MMQGIRCALLFFGTVVLLSGAIKAKLRKERIEGVRLVGGNTATEGRLEVRATGGWGSVCDDYFNDHAARLVCAQLGYENPGAITAAKPRAYFGQGSGPINLDDVRCQGDEEAITNCQHRRYGTHNCGHYEDVGVVCGATEWSRWFDYDNPSGYADSELLPDIYQGACGGASPLYIQVEVHKGRRWMPLLTTDVLIHVGPVYGLVCMDYENRWIGGWGYPYCKNFNTRYSLKKGGKSSWINADTPGAAGDYEWLFANAHKRVIGQASGVEFRTSPRSKVMSHSPIDRFVHVGAKFGFKCYNEENANMGLPGCRDYRTRYLCYKLK